MRSSRSFRLLFSLGLVAAICGSNRFDRAAAQGYTLGSPVTAVNTVVPPQTTNQPVFIATADVNGDGIPDLIYIDADATPAKSTTHVMLGDGNGGFSQSALISTAGVSLAIGDLLGNGKVDIGWLTSSESNGAITANWYVATGVGDGTFGPTVSRTDIALPKINVQPVFSTLKAGDIAGAPGTVPEIVAVDTANNQIFAFPIYAGSLAADYTGLVKGPGPLTVADLNNDTYDDILVDAQADSTVQVYLGSSIATNAVFGINGGYFDGISGVQSLALADFNGDGKLDMAAENPLGHIDIFPGNGDGSFESTSIGSTSAVDDTQGNGGTLIVARDLNYDGIPDMLAFSPLGVSVEIGTATGAFNYTGSYSGGPGTGRNGQFATADFNGGGGLDVALDAPNGIVILYGRTLIARPEPSLVGDAFTLTADIGPDPTGTVTFYLDGALLGTSNVQADGTATWPIPTGNAYPAGVYTLKGEWLENPGARPVELTGTHTIIKFIATTGTLNAGGPTAFEADIPVSVTINPIAGKPAPTGTVTFTISGETTPYPQPAASQLVNGSVSYRFLGTGPTTGQDDPVLPGTNTVTAVYSGDPNYAGITLTAPHVVNLGMTTVTLTPLAPTPVLGPTFFYGQFINGTVTILPQDQSSITLPTNPPTTAPRFPLKGTWEQLSNGVGVPGCTALAPTGSSCPYGFPNVIDAGNYVWVEQYNGGPANGDKVNGSADSTPYVFMVLPDTTTSSLIQSSLNPSPLGTAVTFTVTLTGNFAIPTGPVQFFDGGSLLGTAILNAAGQASFTTANLHAGSHQITAVYAATLDFNAATSPALTQIVVATPLPSVVSLISSLNPSLVGQPVTFTAAASVPGPFAFQVQSGTMTFLDGATEIGTGQINQFGQATFTTSALAPGSHPITASYAGGSNPAGQPIAASVSAVLTQLVETPLHSPPPGITLTVTPNPVSLEPGSTGILLVTVTALSGFSQPTALTCTGPDSSNELGCSFIQPTIPVGGGSTTLDLVTTAPFPCGGNPTHPYFKQDQAAAIIPAVVPGCGLSSSPNGKVRVSGWSALSIGAPMLAGLIWLWPKRRRRRPHLLALLLMAAAIGLSGCGGNCSNLGTRPGSYNVTVTAKAGTVTQQVVVNLSVLDPL